MRILITGGSGFIGTNLIAFLANYNHDILNIDICNPRNFNHIPYWSAVDIRDRNLLETAVLHFQPEYVIHLAARTDLDGSTLDEYNSNIIGVENLVKICLTCNSIKRIIFASSRLVCKIGYSPVSDTDFCPTTLYGESKVQTENIVRKYASNAHWSWTIVRPTSIWGPWFGVPYKTFFDLVISGRYVHPLRSKVFKSFGYVGNTVFQLNSLLTASESLVNRNTFYLADYSPIEVMAMANLIRDQLSLSPVKQVPLSLLTILAGFGDVAKYVGIRNPPLTSFRLANLLTPMVHKLESLEEIVGALPYSTNSGIVHTLEWMTTEGVA